MKLEQVFYQESDREKVRFPLVCQGNYDKEPKISFREVFYCYKVTCWYSRKLKTGIINIELEATQEGGFPAEDKNYSEKHLSEYPSSALAIRDAIRLFDEAVAEGLPDRNKTEEDAWAEWRESQNPEPKEHDAPKPESVGLDLGLPWPTLSDTVKELIDIVQDFYPKKLTQKERESVAAELIRRVDFDSDEVMKIVAELQRQESNERQIYVPKLMPLDDAF